MLNVVDDWERALPASFFEKKLGKKLSGISFTSAYSVTNHYAVGV